MGGACGTYGERRDAYKVLVRKPEGKMLLGRPKRRWNDTIKCIFKIWYAEWTGLVWLRKGRGGGGFANVVMKFLIT
jgi:hypothetical protein